MVKLNIFEILSDVTETGLWIESDGGKNQGQEPTYPNSCINLSLPSGNKAKNNNLTL